MAEDGKRMARGWRENHSNFNIFREGAERMAHARAAVGSKTIVIITFFGRMAKDGKRMAAQNHCNCNVLVNISSLSAQDGGADGAKTVVIIMVSGRMAEDGIRRMARKPLYLQCLGNSRMAKDGKKMATTYQLRA